MLAVNKTIYLVADLMRKFGYDFKECNNKNVIAMKKKIQELGKIEFKIEQYPDGSWTAESTNIDGIITGGKDAKEITATMKDATFTYFGIPPHMCKDAILKSNNEPVIIKQQVYV